MWEKYTMMLSNISSFWWIRNTYSPHSASFLGRSGFTYVIANVSVPRSSGVAQAEYPVASDSPPNLHNSTHWLQMMHRNLSIVHVFSARSTTIACDGQRFIQIVHDLHFDGSNTIWPRVASKCFAGSAGNVVVTGLCVTCFRMVFSIFISLTSPYTRCTDQLSVQSEGRPHDLHRQSWLPVTESMTG